MNNFLHLVFLKKFKMRSIIDKLFRVGNYYVNIYFFNLFEITFHK